MAENVNVWVSSGGHASPFYVFYSDSQGKNELVNFTINPNNTYTFRRLNSATSHPFYISDSGVGENHSSLISITGDGSPQRGITGSQQFTLSFNRTIDAIELLYYCSSHSNMQLAFEISNVSVLADQSTNPVVFEENHIIRLYNTSQNKHLFSSNSNEIDILTSEGWIDEGAIYSKPSEGSVQDVFRFYVASENRHFYTASEQERDLIINNQQLIDSGWQFEGAVFSAFKADARPDDAVAIYRYLNQSNGNHIYSTSTYEQELLNNNSEWLNEGIAWYGESI